DESMDMLNRCEEEPRHSRRALMLSALVMAAIVWPGATAWAQIPSAPQSVSVYSGSATMPPVTVSVTPSSSTVPPGATLQFTAAVVGSANTAVVWSATGGTISNTGLYTSGGTSGTFSVKATISGGTIAGTA